MYGASFCRRKTRSASAVGPGSREGTTYATSSLSFGTRSFTTTAASRTPGMQRERGLDLRQLDAEAADLDLAIPSSQKHETAVGQESPEVAGAIDPLTGNIRIGCEDRGRVLRVPPVAFGDVRALDDQLTRLADGDRLACFVDELEATCPRPAGPPAPGRSRPPHPARSGRDTEGPFR